jgi:hypothetical protein
VDELLAVDVYIARWTRLGQQLARVNITLSIWDEWECNEHLPAELRRDVPRPAVGHDEAKEIQEMLIDELGKLETDFIGRN